jgi:nucleotide-binding universal stress UspA family protein
MHTIKNIIVPTDFSVTARNAFHYARHLAENLHATLTLVHVNEYFLPSQESTVSPIADLEISQVSAEAIEAFIAEEEGDDDSVMVKSQVKVKVLRGDTVGNLLELSNNPQTDLIVMGATGIQDFISKIIGNISLQVARNAHCPVLLVPRDVRWSQINSILYASNYDTVTAPLAQQITDFGRALRASVHFVHVSDGHAIDQKVIQSISDAVLSTDGPELPFQVHAVHGDNILDELQTYAEAHQIDLLAFVSIHHSFWQNMMYKTMIQDLSLSSDKPILIMHLA